MNRLALILALFLLPGCTTIVVTKTSPDGTVSKAEYYSIFKDHSAEELTIPIGDKSATLKGGSTTVNPAVNDIAATAKNLSERVP